MPRTDPSLLSWRRTAGFAIALFLIIWGVKLAVIDRFGSDVPQQDQWWREGAITFIPWLEHGDWHGAFTAHNEHRIVPTLLLNLALLLGGGQWDARVQLVVNAALHASIAVGLFVWAARRLARVWAIATAAVAALVFAPPIVWENLLWGFQSQFYFVIGFSLLAIGGLLASAFSLWWWVGLAAGSLAIVSLGSGFLWIVPVTSIVLFRLKHDPRRVRALIALSVAISLAAFGATIRGHAPWNDELRAHGMGPFLLFTVRNLAWPLRSQPWFALIVWLPWLALLFLRFRSSCADDARIENETTRDYVLAGGAWILLQAVAISLARGGRWHIPTRYGDLIAPGIVFSFWALALLATRWRGARSTWVAAAWFCAITLSLGIAAEKTWRIDLPKQKQESTTIEEDLRRFVLTDDAAAVTDKPWSLSPNPDWPVRAVSVLRHPLIRERLPSSIAVPQTPMSAWSHGAWWLARHGAWIAAAGLALGAGVVLMLRRPVASGGVPVRGP